MAGADRVGGHPARLEGHPVQDCRYRLYASNYSYPTATVTLLGDTILPDSTTYDRYGIRVDGKWQPTISANRVTGGYYGIGLSTTDGAVAATLDSNVVTGTGYAGIYLYYLPGPVAGSYNNVYSNGLYGVYDYVAGTGHGLTQGRFVGNAAYAVYTLGSNFAFDATSNWWGAATGPHTPGADSVLGNITTAPYDTTDPGGVTVPLAPPFTGVAAAAPAPAAPVGAALSAPPVSPAAPDASGVADVRARHAERRAAREAVIRDRFAAIPRRVSGYNLPRLLPEPGLDVAKAVVGSVATLATILEDYRRLIEPNATHWAHPGVMAYFASPASAAGILGEMLTASIAQNPMLWRTSPIGTELETVVVGWLRQGLGLPGDFDGFITDTASMSSLIALAGAREAAGLDASAAGLANSRRTRAAFCGGSPPWSACRPSCCRP